MNGITDERLLGILEYVKDTERIPELNDVEWSELIGRNKLVWDYDGWTSGGASLYWLTDKGMDWLTSLRNAQVKAEEVEDYGTKNN